MFFLMTPICLSLGTNVPFYVRGVVYMMFLTPIIVRCFNYQTLFVKLIIMFFFFILYYSFMNDSLSKSNWHGETYFGKKRELFTIGISQNIRLDNYYINKINASRQYIPQGENVICSKQNWGIVSLLDYKPITYEFDVMRLDSIEFSEMIYNKINIDGRLWAISDCYSKSFNYRIEQMECAEIAIDSIVAGDNRYFLLKKNEYEHPIQ